MGSGLSAQLLREVLAWGQGAFYLATGVWPILHMRSFEAVTGPKFDRWLVKAVGALISVIAIVLLLAATRSRSISLALIDIEVVCLAMLSALALAAIDVIYALQGRISKIYLLDAAVEIPLAAAWGLSLFLD